MYVVICALVVIRALVAIVVFLIFFYFEISSCYLAEDCLFAELSSFSKDREHFFYNNTREPKKIHKTKKIQKTSGVTWTLIKSNRNSTA